MVEWVAQNPEESVREFLSNPFELTAKDLLQEENMPLAVAIACCCGGLLLCWLGGWVKAHGKYPVFSNEVLSGSTPMLPDFNRCGPGVRQNESGLAPENRIDSIRAVCLVRYGLVLDRLPVLTNTGCRVLRFQCG
jgi:hypothetical protein